MIVRDKTIDPEVPIYVRDEIRRICEELNEDDPSLIITEIQIESLPSKEREQ